jgi:hypothetical protein
VANNNNVITCFTETLYPESLLSSMMVVVIRWDEKAGLRAGCGVRSQVIDVLKAQEIKETGNEEG